MSLSRLRERVPGAQPLGRFVLGRHALRFHKSSKDGSAKCDAFYTGDEADCVHGALYEISPAEKLFLDSAEGLGYGYDEKVISVHGLDCSSIEASTYFATAIDENLKPYSWYLHHVLVGAREIGLPEEYVRLRISEIGSTHDPDTLRDMRERAIHRVNPVAEYLPVTPPHPNSG